MIKSLACLRFSDRAGWAFHSFNMGYRPERIVMTRLSESPRQVPIHKHCKTDEITITQIIGKEDLTKRMNEGYKTT